MTYVMKWMNLEDIMLNMNKINQLQKDKYCLILVT